jgi:hypothetical protein
MVEGGYPMSVDIAAEALKVGLDPQFALGNRSGHRITGRSRPRITSQKHLQ